MDLSERISALITPSLEAKGYELVRVRLSGGGQPTLQVMAERRDGTAMTADDCARLSGSLSAILDVDDPIKCAYTLEVSSPGIDRPLTRCADFERFAGFEAKLETGRPIDGRRRFRGRLLGVTEGVVRLALAEEEIELAFEDIEQAKLVMTDELLHAMRTQ